MTYEEFENYVTIVKNALDTEIAMSKVIGVNYTPEYTDHLIMAVCTLLEKYFEDDTELISYWMWDLNFGEEFQSGMIHINGKSVEFKTIKDLWEALT